MLRILLLIIVGFIVATGALRTIFAIIAFVADMSRGGQYAPELTGTIVGSLLVTLGLGWVWRKIYSSGKKDSDSLIKTK